MTSPEEPITFVGTEHAQQRIEKLQERREAIRQGAAAVRQEAGQVSDFALGLLEDWAQGRIEMQQVVGALAAFHTPASSSESSESPHHS